MWASSSRLLMMVLWLTRGLPAAILALDDWQIDTPVFRELPLVILGLKMAFGVVCEAIEAAFLSQ